MQFPYFYFGARYHPEWYPHDAALLEEDAALMKSLHMNAVIISASAVHYVIGLGGGYSWLSGIISRLGENGIDSVVEVPDPLPPVDILRRLNEDGYVRFFMVCSEKAGKALQTIRALRAVGIEKEVCVRVKEQALFTSEACIREADMISTGFNLDRKTEEGELIRKAAFLLDRARSVKKDSFILTDIDPAHVRFGTTVKLKRNGLLSKEIFQAVTHGAKGCFFREFRQAVSGEQRYEGAVIAHSGRTDTRTFLEIEQVGRLLGELSELALAGNRSRCAVVCGDDSMRADAFRAYTALRTQGIGVDVLEGSESFAGYSFVISCGMRRVSERVAAEIRSYIEKGGIWLAGWGFATEDAEGNCYTGDVPHALTDVFGIRIQETEGLEADEELPLTTAADFKGHFTSKRICEIPENLDADVVIKYDRDFFKGRPALSRKQFGQGFAYYLATDCPDALMGMLYDKILNNLKPDARVRMIEGIAVQRLSGEDAEYLVFQNFTDKEKRLLLDYNKLDILFGYDPVPVSGMFVLRVPRQKKERV